MKILFLSHRVPYPPNKGEKIRTYHQIEFLANEGHHVDVLSPFETKEDATLASGLSEKLAVSVKGDELGFKPIRLLKGLLNGESLSEANFHSAKIQRLFDQQLQSAGYDWIICTSSSMAKYVFKCELILKKKSDKPGLIMDFMDLDSDKWAQYVQLKPFPLNWIYKRESRLIASLEKKTQELFDACLFISENEVSLFKSRIGDHSNSYTVANGLDTKTFYPSNANNQNTDPVFIFTGVMDYFPNEDAVLWFCETMWPQIKEKYPGSEFYIAGMKPSSKVQKLAELPGVIVTGFVDDIVDFYHKADIFIAPFRLARGVQNKVLQAFACGLPVITTNCGAEGINCQHQTHLLIANNEQEFIDSVDTLMTDKKLSQTLTSNALELVNSQYSWPGRLSPLKNIINPPKSS